MFDPACGFLRRGKNNNAMKLLKKAKVNGAKAISHKKVSFAWGQCRWSIMCALEDVVYGRLERSDSKSNAPHTHI